MSFCILRRAKYACNCKFDKKFYTVKAFKKISNIDINNTKEDIILTDEDLVNISNVTIKPLD